MHHIIRVNQCQRLVAGSVEPTSAPERIRGSQHWILGTETGRRGWEPKRSVAPAPSGSGSHSLLHTQVHLRKLSRGVVQELLGPPASNVLEALRGYVDP